MDEALKLRVARRIKARREQLGLTQADLAERMSINHRQTVAAIEGGERNIRPEELAAAARALEVKPDFFTDPFSAVGEASFSFRAKANSPAELADFEVRAGRWMAIYRELGAEGGHAPSLLTPALSLTVRSSFEDAQAAADQVRQALRLGRYPAGSLQEALEREWAVLVLNVDAPPEISGAASRLDGLWTIIINRQESSGRRSYDLAHELFHLLTWDAMVPRRIDSDAPTAAYDDKRVEQLAENFAAALLMPWETVRALWGARDGALDLAPWIASAAAELGVSGPALKRRLLNLDLVQKHELPDDQELTHIKADGMSGTAAPQLFSARFVDRIYAAVESGTLSLRKASKLLDLNAAAFVGLCRAYGRQLSYEV